MQNHTQIFKIKLKPAKKYSQKYFKALYTKTPVLYSLKHYTVPHVRPNLVSKFKSVSISVNTGTMNNK